RCVHEQSRQIERVNAEHEPRASALGEPPRPRLAAREPLDAQAVRARDLSPWTAAGLQRTKPRVPPEPVAYVYRAARLPPRTAERDEIGGGDAERLLHEHWNPSCDRLEAQRGVQ